MDSNEELQDRTMNKSRQSTIRSEPDVDFDNDNGIMVTQKVVVSSAEADEGMRVQEKKDHIIGWKQHSSLTNVSERKRY